MPPHDSDLTPARSSRQLIRMMVAVVVFFLVCWAPLLIFNALQSLGAFAVHVPGPIKHFKTAFDLMAYANR